MPMQIAGGRPLANVVISPVVRIDARDPAGCAFGDVQRSTGADGAALATLQARD